MSSGQLFLLATLFFLPVAAPTALGWMTGLLATPIFLLLAAHGCAKGMRLAAISLGIAGVGALLLHQGAAFAFSLTLAPLGLMLFISARAGDSAIRSGTKGLIVLGITWILFWTAYGALTGTNLYSLLLKELDLGLEQAVELSKSKEAGFSPEMALRINETTAAIRETIPFILPGLMATMTMVAVWLNMVLMNSLNNYLTGVFPWGRHMTWSLPEHLVWLPIGAVVMTIFGTGWLQHAGVWLVMVAGLLYFIQGLAVLMALFERWRVPPFMRVIIYFFIFFQAYGLLLLSAVGMADVWGNFRKTKETDA